MLYLKLLCNQLQNRKRQQEGSLKFWKVKLLQQKCLEKEQQQEDLPTCYCLAEICLCLLLTACCTQEKHLSILGFQEQSFASGCRFNSRKERCANVTQPLLLWYKTGRWVGSVGVFYKPLFPVLKKSSKLKNLHFQETKNVQFWAFKNVLNHRTFSGYGILKIFRIRESLVMFL